MMRVLAIALFVVCVLALAANAKKRTLPGPHIPKPGRGPGVREIEACGCKTGDVCGAGTKANPFHCCDPSADVCKPPTVCSVEPDCCLLRRCADNDVCGFASYTCVPRRGH